MEREMKNLSCNICNNIKAYRVLITMILLHLSLHYPSYIVTKILKYNWPQYIRDVYQDIIDWENIEFDYDLTASNPANMRIITKIIVGMRAYQQEFPGLVHFDLKVRKMAITSFNNKRSKHDRRVRALERFRANLEEKYPSSGIDKFLEKGYISEEESEDEN
ncbi:hypothetical protein BDA99DRAFT_544649 [Phascolomyces articulosus]|uniref:Uncharacterized protein n=1 Tax=Phascolomyces articulosus TaxID=60185 RepID=A0AAD5JYG6_9FUNG|nr:hypothetical protein BDA99DRAFT_544649 [Phascolomyces articulosus]